MSRIRMRTRKIDEGGVFTRRRRSRSIGVVIESLRVSPKGSILPNTIEIEASWR
jgi:hypothetical protein